MAPRISRFCSLGALACVFGLSGSGCNKPSGTQTTASASQPAASAPSGACAPGASSACAVQAQSSVTRVVFIGKKEACECTRKAIDASWKSLQAVLAAGQPMPVERLEADTNTDAGKVETYAVMKPFMALPAIYFLDVHEGVVEMLQGEVTEAQVRTALR